MPSAPIEPTPIDGTRFAEKEPMGRSYVGPVIATMMLLLWFFGFEHRYGGDRGQTALQWLWAAWNGENDYQHGPFFPLVIVGLVIYRYQSLKAAVGKGSAWGLLVVFLGALLYAVGYRTLQPRIALGGLPFLVWGGVWYLWGWRVARILFFPLFFFWLAIPPPSFQQATNQLQILATSMAHQGASLFGVDTLVQGNEISSAHGKWDPLEIAKGCSGIRSLMALMMISGAWACAANLAFWKRAILFLSAFPLAILGNTLRLISIFVIGEYGDAKWARSTWHDWSGLLLFYPFSLMLLLILHSLLEGGLPWRKENRRQLRRVTVTRADDGGQPEPPTPES